MTRCGLAIQESGDDNARLEVVAAEGDEGADDAAAFGRMPDGPASLLGDGVLGRMRDGPASLLGDGVLGRMPDGPASLLGGSLSRATGALGGELFLAGSTLSGSSLITLSSLRACQV